MDVTVIESTVPHKYMLGSIYSGHDDVGPNNYIGKLLTVYGRRSGRCYVEDSISEDSLVTIKRVMTSQGVGTHSISRIKDIEQLAFSITTVHRIVV